MKPHCLFIIAISIAACGKTRQPTWEPMASPAGADSETPGLHAGPDGTIYLTWIEWADDTTSLLLFSRLDGTSWSPKKEIARGTDWFVNWADTPGLTAFGDGRHLAAHWLRKRAAGKYDYDIVLALSPDGGETWQPPFILHDDGIAAEHGFVSATRDGDRIFYAWLDGRHTKKEGSVSTHGHDHHGAMSLRGAWLDTAGVKSGEGELDSLVCDCCQTTVAKTNHGLLVSYRDRSAEEIRDIAHVRWNGMAWSSPEIVRGDLWKIAGCPVNGPALAATGDTVCRVWFGTADSVGHVTTMLSFDGGLTWKQPVRLDGHNPLGRVDVTAVPTGFRAMWIGYDNDGTSWLSTALIPASGHTSSVDRIARMDPGRTSGCPVITGTPNAVVAAYTMIEADTRRVQILLARQ